MSGKYREKSGNSQGILKLRISATLYDIFAILETTDHTQMVLL